MVSVVIVIVVIATFSTTAVTATSIYVTTEGTHTKEGAAYHISPSVSPRLPHCVEGLGEGRLLTHVFVLRFFKCLCTDLIDSVFKMIGFKSGYKSGGMRKKSGLGRARERSGMSRLVMVNAWGSGCTLEMSDRWWVGGRIRKGSFLSS